MYLFFTAGLSLQHRALVCFHQWLSVAVEVEVGLGWGEVLSPAVCSADGASEGLDVRLEPQPPTGPRLCQPGAQDKAPFQHSLSFTLTFFPFALVQSSPGAWKKMRFIIIMISITTFILHWVMGKDQVFKAYLFRPV